MAGQLIKRGERTWLVRIFLGYDSETRKRRYLNKTIHGTRHDAERWMLEALTRRDTGAMIDTDKAVPIDIFEQFIHRIERAERKISKLK